MASKGSSTDTGTFTNRRIKDKGIEDGAVYFYNTLIEENRELCREAVSKKQEAKNMTRRIKDKAIDEQNQRRRKTRRVKAKKPKLNPAVEQVMRNVRSTVCVFDKEQKAHVSFHTKHKGFWDVPYGAHRRLKKLHGKWLWHLWLTDLWYTIPDNRLSKGENDPRPPARILVEWNGLTTSGFYTATTSDWSEDCDTGLKDFGFWVHKHVPAWKAHLIRLKHWLFG